MAAQHARPSEQPAPLGRLGSGAEMAMSGSRLTMKRRDSTSDMAGADRPERGRRKSGDREVGLTLFRNVAGSSMSGSTDKISDVPPGQEAYTIFRNVPNNVTLRQPIKKGGIPMLCVLSPPRVALGAERALTDACVA